MPSFPGALQMCWKAQADVLPTFQLSRPSFVRATADAWIAVTAGTDFFYPYLIIDAVALNGGITGDGPKGYYNCSFEVVTFLLFP